MNYKLTVDKGDTDMMIVGSRHRGLAIGKQHLASKHNIGWYNISFFLLFKSVFKHLYFLNTNPHVSSFSLEFGRSYDTGLTFTSSNNWLEM